MYYYYLTDGEQCEHGHWIQLPWKEEFGGRDDD